MLAEIADSFKEVVEQGERGDDDGWVEINVYESCMRVITRVLARLSVGSPLCGLFFCFSTLVTFKYNVSS